MVIISRGSEAKMEFPEGRGGLFWEPILENPERGSGHRKNPFRGGGMEIFWNYTMLSSTSTPPNSSNIAVDQPCG